MEYSVGIEKDAFSYFDESFFDKDKAIKTLGFIPKLSLFKIDGTWVCGIQDQEAFLNACNDVIKKVIDEGFKLMLYANVFVNNKNSRIERYKKVWKLLKQKWDLEKFQKGNEVEINIGENLLYSSIAEFDISSFATAVRIVANWPDMFTMLAAGKNEIPDDREVETISRIAFSGKFEEIDYFKLALHYCTQGGIVFRYSNCGEESLLSLIFQEELLKYFESKVEVLRNER